MVTLLFRCEHKFLVAHSYKKTVELYVIDTTDIICRSVEFQGTTAIIRKYRQLVRTLKQTRVEQVILSGILPVMGRRGHKYRNCRGMAINMLVQKLCREEEVGFVDLWGSFAGRADMYMKDGLHLSGKGAAVFADKLSAAVDSDLGTMTNIF